MFGDSRLPDRFWSKVQPEPNSGCWLWSSNLAGGGYGQFSWNSKPIYAHRLVFLKLKGKIPSGLQLDHLCRTRSCVNPDHLEAVSQRENILRGESPSASQARQTHCLRGHEFNAKNTHVDKKGKRSCRVCARERDAKRRRKKGMRIKDSSRCIRGHLFDEKNTRYTKQGRQCRACSRLRDKKRNKRKIAALSLLAIFSNCSEYLEPAPDHYRDQVSDTIFKLEGQDETWLIERARVEDYLGRHVKNLLQYDWDENVLAVWWVDDQPCPYKPERNAIIGCKDLDCPRRCYAGQTWGAAEIYVATYQQDQTQVCGTALVHEYGHVMRDLAELSADGPHKDIGFWNEFLPAVGQEICDNYLAREQLAVDLEMAAGNCEAAK